MTANASSANRELFVLVRDVCTEMGFAFPDEILSGLTVYLSLLVRWNKVMNLVGMGDPEDILRRLIADSFYLAEFIDELPLPTDPEIWDLGAGAGLPGIGLRLLRRQGSYTMVEARDKRAGFLQIVLAACPLPGVRVFRGRAEQFMPTRPKAAMVVSRAFLPWEKVLALVAPYTAPAGLCVFLTLEPAPAEPASDVPPGWIVHAQRTYAVAGENRWFWALRKMEDAVPLL